MPTATIAPNGSAAPAGSLETLPADARSLFTRLLGDGAAILSGITADDDITFHENPADKRIIVPRGTSYEHLLSVITRKRDEDEEVHDFTKIFRHRPDDGAHAGAIVLKRLFGMTIGKAEQTMFGKKNPGYRTIAIGPGKFMDVPWGKLEIPALPGADVKFVGTQDDNGTPVFAIVCNSPKKHRAAIQGMFDAIERELQTNSIYRGKALTGAHELKFMPDLDRFDARKIVFSDEVHAMVDSGVFSLLRYPEATVAAGLPTKRSVLAFGPYGTGKSSLGLMTAQVAVENGWTYLEARAGQDDLRSVFRTAKLYQPAVVFIEDIDVHTPNAGDGRAISELLDLFDGIGTKSDRLLVVMTTNHIEQITSGMLRPGRLDWCIEIAGLDRQGCERLIRALVPEDLIDFNVDFDAVYREMEGFQPAWVAAVATRAVSLGMARNGGRLNFALSTRDLVIAAISLQPQLRLMDAALEGIVVPDLHTATENIIAKAVERVVEKTTVLDYDNDYHGKLVVNAKN